MLFAFFAAMAETERENIREATLEGLNAAARKGNHGGRPPVITNDMLHTLLRRRKNGESLHDIRPDLIIPPANAKAATPAWPASTARSPSTRNARPTPKPSSKPTPISPHSSRATERPGYRLVSHIRLIFGENYGDPVFEGFHRGFTFKLFAGALLPVVDTFCASPARSCRRILTSVSISCTSGGSQE